MRLDWLAGALRDKGCQVIEYTGWKTRTMKDFDSFNPVGLIDHHTAGSSILTDYPSPPYWPNDKLASKCNLTIRPDGICVTLNAGYAYDSGLGAWQVRDAVKADKPLPSLSGLTSTINGNPLFIDIEVQHLGNGDPIHPPQREALILANAAICEHMGWNPATRLIGHREWAPDRKVDPRWGGFTNPMPQIRKDTTDAMALTADDKAWLKKLLEDHDAVFEYTNVKGDKRRMSYLALNSAWHVDIAGKIAMDQLAAAGKALDPADVAVAIVAEQGPDFGAIVAAELKKLTLKAQ